MNAPSPTPLGAARAARGAARPARLRHRGADGQARQPRPGGQEAPAPAAHPRPTASFGKGTKRAVKHFQRRARPDRRRHRRPRDVARAQAQRRRARRAAGASASRAAGRASGCCSASSASPPTASSAPATQRAVKSFQRRRGLTADGDRRPGDVGRARRPRPPPGPQARPPARRLVDAAAASRSASSARSAPPTGSPTKPYRLGGGHRSFTDSGYDCCGLGLLRPARGGRAAQPARLRLARPLGLARARAAGSPIYAHGGHAFMVIRGRRFDTSMRGPGGSRWTSQMRSTAGYTVRHPPGL